MFFQKDLNLMPTISFKLFPSGRFYNDNFPPVPASKVVPEWFKALPAAKPTQTRGNFLIKQCFPVLDSIIAGYVIFTPCDFVVRQDGDKDTLSFETPTFGDYDIINMHSSKQFEGAPFASNVPSIGAYKLDNPYRIYTDRGYSCTFQTPAYSDTPIKILPGVVDTDEQHQVNFPFQFVMPEGKTELFVPLGTPLAQVIPFKREIFTMSVEEVNEKDVKKDAYDVFFLREAYKRLRRSRKIYR